MEKVLVIACHPDDETLGCGGTLLRHRAHGDDIYWVILTNIDEQSGWAKGKVKARQNEIDHVADSYGFKKIFKLNFPTTQLDQLPKSELIKALSGALDEVKPSIVYLPNPNDVHSDHQAAFQVAYSSAKTFRQSSIKKILAYECLSETEFAPPLADKLFIPNVFVDITEYFDMKAKIMHLYAGEIAPFPFPRSLENMEALAKFRGATVGVMRAEAFMLLKEIQTNER